MNIIFIYLIYTVTSQEYMFKHNVNTAQKYEHTISISDYIAYLNVLQIYFFWTSIRTCVSAYAWIRAWRLTYIGDHWYNTPTLYQIQNRCEKRF